MLSIFHLNTFSQTPILSSSSSAESIKKSSKEMSVEEKIAIGQEVMPEVRDQITDKSINKFYNPSIVLTDKQEILYSKENLLKRANKYAQLESERTKKKSKVTIADITLANCSDLSSLILWRLQQRISWSNSIHLVSVSEDHALVVWGEFGEDGKLAPGTVVLDGWAKIVCEISDFPGEWRAKMDKWEKRGMLIDPEFAWQNAKIVGMRGGYSPSRLRNIGENINQVGKKHILNIANVPFFAPIFRSKAQANIQANLQKLDKLPDFLERRLIA